MKFYLMFIHSYFTKKILTKLNLQAIVVEHASQSDQSKLSLMLSFSKL